MPMELYMAIFRPHSIESVPLIRNTCGLGSCYATVVVLYQFLVFTLMSARNCLKLGSQDQRS